MPRGTLSVRFAPTRTQKQHWQWTSASWLRLGSICLSLMETRRTCREKLLYWGTSCQHLRQSWVTNASTYQIWTKSLKKRCRDLKQPRKSIMPQRIDWAKSNRLRIIWNRPIRLLMENSTRHRTCRLKLRRKSATKKKLCSKNPKNSSNLELSRPILLGTFQVLSVLPRIWKQTSKNWTKRNRCRENFSTMLSSPSNKWNAKYRKPRVSIPSKKPRLWIRRSSKLPKNFRRKFHSWLS